MVIDRFVGQYAFLSNFSRTVVVLDGETYLTVEHAFQAAKVEPTAVTRRWDQTSRQMLEVRWRDLVRACDSPSRVKALGRQLPLREHWETSLRVSVMRELLLQKFSHGRRLLPLLLETQEAQLIEGNTWHDNFWGSCTCCRPTCLPPGANTLGVLLMDIRALRRAEAA